MKFEIEISQDEIQEIVLAHLEETFDLSGMDAKLRIEAYGPSRMSLWPREDPLEKEES